MMHGSIGSRLGRGLGIRLQPLWQAVLTSGLLSDWLGAKGAGVGHGVVGTWTTDICAIGAQSCVTTVPEHSYVMVQ